MIHYVLIRHGETEFNRQRRFQGQSDSILTPRGRRQMMRHSRRLQEYNPDIIFSSKLGRCKSSAQIAVKGINKKLKLDARLNEIHFGEWEGLTADELYESGNPEYKKWYHGKRVTPKKGESIPQFRKRIKSFINDCQKKYDNKKIIIFAHGGTIRMFIAELLNWPEKSLFQFRIDSGTITIIGQYEFVTQLVELNSNQLKPGIVPQDCC